MAIAWRIVVVRRAEGHPQVSGDIGVRVLAGLAVGRQFAATLIPNVCIAQRTVPQLNLLNKACGVLASVAGVEEPKSLGIQGVFSIVWRGSCIVFAAC